MAIGQQFSVQQPQIASLLAKIRGGEIAIPEIQRPFVWEATKVRNLLDSLYQGFPVGFLIGWKNPDVKLKDGTTAGGKLILIDGQQRVTALMAALLGMEVVNRHYRTVHIRIAFHPVRRQFEVYNPAIGKDVSWIPDVSQVFAPQPGLFNIVNDYCAKNPDLDQQLVFESLSALQGITGNQIGFIELSHDLDIETVTEIFIRVNSTGVPLGQADFAMSKIAVNEKFGGNTLRKAIDYFCHLAKAPDFYSTMKNDSSFVASEYFGKLDWLKSESENLYDPSYIDMLRVAYTSQFKRGRIADLVALLSGRNFESKKFEEEIVENSFMRLRQGVLNFMSQDSFSQLMLTLRSVGFVDASMIGSANAINFSYVIYLVLRERGFSKSEIDPLIRRWFVMSLLTARHSGSFETRFEQDVRMFADEDPGDYVDQICRGDLSDAFWDVVLPAQLRTSSINAVPFQLYKAAQIRLKDKGFLSLDFDVHSLVTIKSDVHHLFPRDYLKKGGVSSTSYNQIANYVIAQSEINIAIGNKEPTVYFGQLQEQVDGGPKRYGNITDPEELRENLQMNCIPDSVAEMGITDYPEFLEARRKLMAQKIRTYFEGL